MKHIWSILCKRSVIDNETNLVSLFDSLEQLDITVDKNKLGAEKKITIPIDFEIVSFWVDNNTNKDREFEIRINLFDPNNKKLSTLSGRHKMKKGIKRLRNRAKIKGLILTTEGRYLFKVKIKEGNKYKKVAEIPLDIDIKYKLL